MTTPTDEDREAAAAVFAAKGEDHFAKIARAGQCDDWKEVQAFTAHRLLGQRQGIEMAAKAVEDTDVAKSDAFGARQLCYVAVRSLPAAPEAEQ